MGGLGSWLVGRGLGVVCVGDWVGGGGGAAYPKGDRRGVMSGTRGMLEVGCLRLVSQDGARGGSVCLRGRKAVRWGGSCGSGSACAASRDGTSPFLNAVPI